MKSSEIRSRFLNFFEKRGHAIIPSASLVPENDPTVLFNTAGMQPLVPYLLGEKHPAGTRLADIQKCIRTTDIEDVGDNTHATFFEMMGNWSLGDYFKKDAITWSYELLTSKEEGFGLDPNRLYVTVFEGDALNNVPRDEEAASIWQSLFDKDGVKGNHIFYLGADANWWPAVKKDQDTWSGPTGPCSEMFYDVTGTLSQGLTQDEFLAADEEQKVVEIWNDVFMEYKKDNGKIVSKLESKNVDTGSGFERMAMVLQGKTNIFDTDIFQPIFDKISEFIPENLNMREEQILRAKRIIADHTRAAVMLISDGVVPSNTDQGYILRRLIRRAVRLTDTLGMKHSSLFWIADTVAEMFKDVYKNVGQNKETIKITIDKEEQKFRNTLSKGLKELEKSIERSGGKEISGKDAFVLFSSYGFPIEMTREIAKEKGVTIDNDSFNEEMKKHQELSRAGAEQKFKGGLGDTSEMSLKYHTATHLLHQALREVLGTHVGQKGSNITPERLRFDFSHTAKMTDEEKKRVEDIVNEKIQAALPVHVVTLPEMEAQQTGALHFFGEKYGDTVTVYYIGHSLEDAFSKEYCGGPHVKNTSELGTFKIQKEEAVSQGVRRIKAVLS